MDFQDEAAASEDVDEVALVEEGMEMGEEDEVVVVEAATVAAVAGQSAAATSEQTTPTCPSTTTRSTPAATTTSECVSDFVCLGENLRVAAVLRAILLGASPASELRAVPSICAMLRARNSSRAFRPANAARHRPAATRDFPGTRTRHPRRNWIRQHDTVQRGAYTDNWVRRRLASPPGRHPRWRGNLGRWTGAAIH